ncbi:MAG: hypothetical protein J6X71_06580 [Bacteroidales bacterium]|nr:hypothetical protein [Bacteroidales bacterium]
MSESFTSVPDPIQTVRFYAEPVDTKARFGEDDGNGVRPTLWSSNDSEVKLSLNYGSAVAAGVVPSSDFGTASFEATFDFSEVSGPYTFYSVSPASAALALSPSRSAWKVSIPCEQTPSDSSPDEAGIILAAASDEYASTTQVGDVNLYFNHLTAYGRMSLVNLDLADGETVSAVELTVTTPIVGDWYWETSGSGITDYGASSTLTVNTSRTSDIWFACAPVEVGGEMMTVSVFTSAGCHEQLVEFPAGRKFEAGQVAVFSVDMDGAEFIAAGSGSVSSPVTASMTAFTSVSGYVGGDENVSYEASQGDAQTAPGVFSDEIRIYQNGGLLTITANNDKTITNVTIGSSMATKVQVMIDSGSFGSDNNISANGTFSTGTISASTVVFKCTGTSKTARLYLNSLSVTYAETGSSAAAGPDPMLQKSEYGCWLGTGLEWTLDPGVHQVTRSYDTDGVLTYTLINPDTVEELELTGYKKSFVKGDRVTLTVNWRYGRVNRLNNASYTMTVIKEQGPMVWLSDGNGKGAIIKK